MGEFLNGIATILFRNTQSGCDSCAGGGIVTQQQFRPVKGYFVLEIEFIRGSGRHSYKVPFSDLSYTKLKSAHKQENVRRLVSS